MLHVQYVSTLRNHQIFIMYIHVQICCTENRSSTTPLHSTYLAQASVNVLTIPALVLNKSSLVIPQIINVPIQY